MTPLRVLLVEDHVLVRAGIRALLEQMPDVEVVGEADNGRQTLQQVKTLRPAVVLMDITMADLNGLDATAYITRDYPQVRVVVLSVHATEPYVVRAVEAGAAGYLVKTAAREELEAALRTVVQGRTYLSPAIASHVTNHLRRLRGQEPGTSVATSTEKPLRTSERELLQLIAEGYTAKEIAPRLHLSQKAIESRRARLMDRLDIHDLPGLIRYAIRLGLIDTESEQG
ncbi:MAG: response regulator [Candidatus Binatia bacterium]